MVALLPIIYRLFLRSCFLSPTSTHPPSSPTSCKPSPISKLRKCNAIIILLNNLLTASTRPSPLTQLLAQTDPIMITARANHLLLHFTKDWSSTKAITTPFILTSTGTTASNFSTSCYYLKFSYSQREEAKKSGAAPAAVATTLSKPPRLSPSEKTTPAKPSLVYQ